MKKTYVKSNKKVLGFRGKLKGKRLKKFHENHNKLKPKLKTRGFG